LQSSTPHSGKVVKARLLVRIALSDCYAIALGK
jgi:hypothetical protein